MLFPKGDIEKDSFNWLAYQSDCDHDFYIIDEGEPIMLCNKCGYSKRAEEETGG
jgi:hypothetical protein